VNIPLSYTALLLCRLDAGSHGYLKVNDWAAPNMCEVVSTFSLMYMRRHLNVPDVTATPEQVARFLDLRSARTVHNLHAAIELANATVAARRCAGVVDPVKVAFQFADTQCTGKVGAQEVRHSLWVSCSGR